MPFSSLRYCRPRLLLLTMFLAGFSLFTFILWVGQKEVSPTSVMYTIASIFTFLSSAMYFIMYIIPYYNRKLKQLSAMFLLCGGILYLISVILEMLSTDLCDYPLCALDMFAFMLIPMMICFILAVDEFTKLFKRSIRLRISVYCLTIISTSVVILPYYFTGHQLLNIYLEIVFEIIWILLFLTGVVLFLMVGICDYNNVGKIDFGNHSRISSATANSTETKGHLKSKSKSKSKKSQKKRAKAKKTKKGKETPKNDDSETGAAKPSVHPSKTKRRWIVWLSVIMILSGSSTLIAGYFLYANHYLMIYNITTCYYFLLTIICWMVGLDCIIGERYRVEIHTNLPSASNENSEDEYYERVAEEEEYEDVIEEDISHSSNGRKDNGEEDQRRRSSGAAQSAYVDEHTVILTQSQNNAYDDNADDDDDNLV